MDVAVLGPGGVGGLIGALLARAGATVTCLASPSTVAVSSRPQWQTRSTQRTPPERISPSVIVGVVSRIQPLCRAAP